MDNYPARSIDLVPRRTYTLALAALFLLLGLFASQAHADVKVLGKKGPAGLSFYNPPKKLIKGKPGSIVWQRELKGSKSASVRLPDAGKTVLVLYRSRDPQGRPGVISGTVDIPKGNAPAGGWKMISWAHGTTGVADVCAPSRNRVGGPAYDYIQYASPVNNEWVKAGYAVLRTDYAGLGTPGPHRYLIGNSEGRSVVDIASAARELFGKKNMSDQFSIGGHSQGGQAALFAGSMAAKGAPGLKLKSVFAYAPASHLYEQRQAAATLDQSFSGLSGMAYMILDSAARESKTNIKTIVTPKAYGLRGSLDKGCMPVINKSFGTIAPKEILQPGANTAKPDTALKAMNPAVKIPGSVLVLQGSADTTVFPFFTDQLMTELEAQGTNAALDQFPGLTHSGVVTDPAVQARVLDYIRSTLGPA